MYRKERITNRETKTQFMGSRNNGRTRIRWLDSIRKGATDSFGILRCFIFLREHTEVHLFIKPHFVVYFEVTVGPLVVSM